MFFATRSHFFCVEIGEHSTLLARFTQAGEITVVEELKELPTVDTGAITEWVKGNAGRGSTGYAHAICGIYPAKRVIRRQTVDLKRLRDPVYFNEIYAQQFRLDPEKYTMRALNPMDGLDYDAGKGAQKEVLFAGLPSDEIIAAQEKLLAQGIYPERLELGTLALLGGMTNYLQFKQIQSPLLLLEIGEELTQSYILRADGVDISRPIPSGIAAMVPVVQKELSLKDEESARKLFYSNTFDFTAMGGTLIKKLLKELQSSIGFYEVQTGQSIGHVYCTQLPSSLAWLGAALAGALGVAPLKIDLRPWLDSLNIKLAEGVLPNPPGENWAGLFSLIASYQPNGVQSITGEKNNAAAAMASPWHSNFRNYQQLPDTKVVRTAFFIKTAAIAVVLGLMLWLGFREYHIYNLRIQIAGSQKEIDTHARANREALRLNKAFEVEAKKIAEAQAFRQALMNPAEFVTLLGQTLPKAITIEFVEARLAELNGGVTFMVRGQVAGVAGEAAGVAAGYVDMLRAHPRLGAVFSAINLANLSRDARSNSLTFDISLRVKADGKEKK